MKQSFLLLTLSTFMFFAADTQAQEPGAIPQMNIDQRILMNKMQNMTPQQLEFMQVMLTEGQKCMGQMPEGQLQELQERGAHITNQIKSLCAQGDRTEAQRYASSQGEIFMKDPAIVKLRGCSEKLVQSMRSMLVEATSPDSNQHVCDGV
jgi:hypothetical protein